MKIALLTILLLFTVNQTFSQVTYFNYLNYTSEWRYYYSGWSGFYMSDEYSTIYFDGDTTINGEQYYKQYNLRILTDYNTPQGTSTTYLNGPYFVREDNTGKFYTYDIINGVDNITFDNQIIVNSQLNDPFPYPGATCNVESIEFINLGTTSLKHIGGSIQGSQRGSLEGVGVIGLACATGIESGGGLQCYTRDGFNLQFGTMNCDSFPVPIHTAAIPSLSDINKSEIAIFPNPTKGSITLQYGSNKNLDLQYEIIDLTGTLIITESINSINQIVDISTLVNGIYIFKIISKNGYKHYKIIKE